VFACVVFIAIVVLVCPERHRSAGVRVRGVYRRTVVLGVSVVFIATSAPGGVICHRSAGVSVVFHRHQKICLVFIATP
jgi:hypothetical protein